MTARQLKAIRRKMGYSQSEFSVALDLNLRTLQDWEQGHRKIGPMGQRVLRLALQKFDRYLFKQGVDKSFTPVSKKS